MSRPGFFAGLRDGFRAVFTTRPALMILVLAGLLYGFYYPAAYRHQVATQLPIAVVDLGQNDFARQLTTRLASSERLHVAARLQDFEAARLMLQRREVDAIVLIPHAVARGVLSGTQPDAVAFYVNGAYLVRASAIGEALQEVLEGAIAQAMEAPAHALGIRAPVPVKVIGHPLFNTREGYGSYVVPGVAVLIVHQTLLMGIVLLSGIRRSEGRRYRSTREILGTAAAYGAIGLFTAFFYFGFVFWFQDYPRGGPAFAMVLATLLFVSATVAFAMFVGSFFDRGERSAQVLAASSALIFFLSGLPWPFSSMPAPLAALAHLLPSTPGVQGLVKINQMHAAVSEVRPELWTLLALAALYGALAWWRLRPTSRAPTP